MSRWPDWWPYVAKVELLKVGDSDEIGSIRRITWKTTPFHLSTSGTIEMQKYQPMESRAFGDLEARDLFFND
ncbi:MAG: hypothetical protein IPN76_35035 [Saprospiraceae bacterium]|nr:hypothetical protein [Saprospiraceae bacterium]